MFRTTVRKYEDPEMRTVHRLGWFDKLSKAGPIEEIRLLRPNQSTRVVPRLMARVITFNGLPFGESVWVPIVLGSRSQVDVLINVLDLVGLRRVENVGAPHAQTHVEPGTQS